MRRKGKYGLGSEWEAVAGTLNGISQRLICRGQGVGTLTEDGAEHV